MVPQGGVGHLIDSAANNHLRFVRAQVQEDLVLAGYEQEAWVARQGYAGAPWGELVGLWRLYNLHLARVMAAAPEAERVRPRARHNLDGVGWRAVAADRPATLEYLMADYVGHLRQHLEQILGGGGGGGSGAGAA